MPVLKKIGLPNAAIYSPAFYDGKRSISPRISPLFWGIITSRPEKQGDPGSFRARKRVRGIKDHKVIFADPGPGRYDPPRENTPDTGPDSRFWIPPLPGKALKNAPIGFAWRTAPNQAPFAEIRPLSMPDNRV